MDVQLTYHSHALRKRKAIKARRNAKNLWSKKKNQKLEVKQNDLSKMIKLGAHFFSHTSTHQSNTNPMYGLKK